MRTDELSMAVARYVQDHAPGAVDGEDYAVTQTSESTELLWNLEIPEPTLSQLEEALLAAKKSAKIAGFETIFASECEADFGSAWAALGVLAASPTDPRVVALKTRVDKLRTKLGEVEAATSLEELGAISWT